MAKDWNVVKNPICDYYRAGKSLAQVRELLGRDHQFNASTRSLRMKLAEWRVRRQDQDRTESDLEQEVQDQQLIKDGKAVARLRETHKEIVRRQESIKASQDGLRDAGLLENKTIKAQERARTLRDNAEESLGKACLYKWRAIMLRRESFKRKEEARAALNEVNASTSEKQGYRSRFNEAHMRVIARERKATKAFEKACLHEWVAFTLWRRVDTLKKEEKAACEEAEACVAELDACRSRFDDVDAQREALEKVQREYEEAQKRLISEVRM
ncbi:hypothetical protein Q7P37_008932 [Cladosporium fusiforme]